MGPIVTSEMVVKLFLPLIGGTFIGHFACWVKFNRTLKSVRNHEGKEKVSVVKDKAKRDFVFASCFMAISPTLFASVFFLAGVRFLDVLAMWVVFILACPMGGSIYATRYMK